MSDLGRRILPVILLAVTVAAVGVAFNQRGTASAWRERALVQTTAREHAERIGADTKRRATELEERLTALARENAERSDEAAYLVVQRDAARRAAERLTGCGDPSRADCHSAIANARATLAAIASEQK